MDSNEPVKSKNGGKVGKGKGNKNGAVSTTISYEETEVSSQFILIPNKFFLLFLIFHYLNCTLLYKNDK